MSETTNLKLKKHDNVTTNTNQFDIQNYLNGNWDKIDAEDAELKDKINSNTTNIEELQKQKEKLENDLKATAILDTQEGQNITLTDSSNASCEIEIMGNSEQEEVPDGYDVLEYIESTGTQYINTNYYPNPNTKVEVDCQFTDAETTQQKMFRVEATDSFIFGMYINGGNYWAYVAADSANWRGTEITADTEKHKFILDSYNSLVKIDNTFSQTITDTRTKTSTVPLPIFNNMYSNATFGNVIAKMKLYSFKIYEKDVLLKHFVPVKRKSDNVIGLYEIINDAFYTNQGTGTFTAGTVSSVPNLDNEIEAKICKDNINLVMCNKNLFYSEMFNNNSNSKGITLKTVPGTNKIILNGTSTEAFSIFSKALSLNMFKIGKKYTLSKNYNERFLFEICENNSNTPSIWQNFLIMQKSYTRIRIYLQSVGTVTFNNQEVLLQIEEGEATDIVEYEGQAFKIPLQQPFRTVGDYRDTFVKQDSKWYEKHIIKRLILDGNETWHKSGNANNVSYWASNSDANYNTISQQGSNNIAKIKSNYFKATSYNGIFTNTKAITLNYLSSNLQRELRLGFGLDTNLTTVALLKEWLAQKYAEGKPFYVDYILETPQLIECTQAQTDILNELEYAHTYNNITHIYSTDDVEANVKVTYKKDLATIINRLSVSESEG